MHTHDTLHKIEKIKMAESIRGMSSEMGDNHGNFDLFNDQDVFEGVIFYYRRFDWKILHILNWIRVYAEKLANAPKSHNSILCTKREKRDFIDECEFSVRVAGERARAAGTCIVGVGDEY